MKYCGATVMGVVLIPMHTLERAALKIVHHVLVIQTVKQIFHFLEKGT
jgi:hypothetical protein